MLEITEENKIEEIIQVNKSDNVIANMPFRSITIFCQHEELNVDVRRWKETRNKFKIERNTKLRRDFQES